MIRSLLFMASTSLDDTVRSANEATALQILDMPFLEDVTTLDALATGALGVLMFADDEGVLQRVMSHPEFRGGITDEWTDLVAVTSFADERPGLLNALLDPERSPVERRVITLPLAGEVTLSVVEPEGFAALSFGGVAAWGADGPAGARSAHARRVHRPARSRRTRCFCSSLMSAVEEELITVAASSSRSPGAACPPLPMRQRTLGA